MIDRTTRLRWRRHFRRRKRQVEDMGQQAEQRLEQHFFRRLGKFTQVRRFVIAWVLLLVLLAGLLVTQTLALGRYYQRLAPVEGGTYTEGIIGAYTNANPLYATSPVDSAVSHLIFASLFTFDTKNQLVGDLAQSWTVDARGTTYTVTLRDKLKWQDGTPLTAEDVVFTYQMIQNPDARSPLQSAWQGIKVSSPDNKRTVNFVLPNSLTSFPYSMVNGIVPKHMLAKIPVTELRSAHFNTTSPMGAGPFKWETIQVTGDKPEERQEQVSLIRNEHYHKRKAKLQRFVIHSYRDEKQMLAGFERRDINAMAGLESFPDNLDAGGVQEYNIPLTDEVVVFFRTDSPLLSDPKVRQALVRGVNVPELVKKLGYPVVLADSPFLRSQLGYDKSITQLSFDAGAANKLLDEAGWIKGKDGTRTKDGKPLTFHLFAQSTAEYSAIVQGLQTAWGSLGVDLKASLQSPSELQQTINVHDYDAILYGIAIGPDPDVFVYWDGSQADPRLISRFNFSNYKSTQADKALQAGRTRQDPTLRAIKYKPFLEAWRNDAPALVLYQPRFLYIVREPLYEFNPRVMNVNTDRYINVTEWMIREEKTTK
jgi:peptide/nickel transport system substrate-binding protein